MDVSSVNSYRYRPVTKQRRLELLSMNLLIILSLNAILLVRGSSSSSTQESSTSSTSEQNQDKINESKTDTSELKDSIDQAVAVALDAKKHTHQKIYELLELLKTEQEGLDYKIKENKKSHRSEYASGLQVRLKAVRFALTDLLLAWAKKILEEQSAPLFQQQDIDRCIEELESYIASQVLIVVEPNRKESKVDQRITNLKSTIERRAESEKQINDDLWLWKKLIEKSTQEQQGERKYLPTQDDSTTEQKLNDVKEKKLAKLKQIEVLLSECKELDSQCFSAQAAQDPNGDRILQGLTNPPILDSYYAHMSSLIKTFLQNVPIREGNHPDDSLIQLQRMYLALLSLEKMSAVAALQSLESLQAINTLSSQNRSFCLPFLQTKKASLAEEYETLHAELESVKLLLVRLKVLGNKPLGDFERERLKKYNEQEKNKGV